MLQINNYLRIFFSKTILPSEEKVTAQGAKDSLYHYSSLLANEKLRGFSNCFFSSNNLLCISFYLFSVIRNDSRKASNVQQFSRIACKILIDFFQLDYWESGSQVPITMIYYVWCMNGKCTHTITVIVLMTKTCNINDVLTQSTHELIP